MRALVYTGFAGAFIGAAALSASLAKPETPFGRQAGPKPTTAAAAQRSAAPLAIDGDTFLWKGERIKLAGVDAPEVLNPRCEVELGLGLAAKRRLAAVLGNGTITIERQGEDVYGQTLARVSVDRRDVADQLVAEGQVLAYQRGSAAKLDRLAQWCGTTAALESVGKS